MSRDRANLKVSPEELARFNDLRGGTTQAEFFTELLDVYEADEPAGEPRIAAGDTEQLDRIESRLEALSDEHGGLEDQLTSIVRMVESAAR